MPWYLEITNGQTRKKPIPHYSYYQPDSAFLNELRWHMRFLLAMLYIKFRKVDVRRFLTKTLPSIARDHLRACWEAHRALKRQSNTYTLQQFEATVLATFEVAKLKCDDLSTTLRAFDRIRAISPSSQGRMRPGICALSRTACSPTFFLRRAFVPSDMPLHRFKWAIAGGPGERVPQAAASRSPVQPDSQEDHSSHRQSTPAQPQAVRHVRAWSIDATVRSPLTAHHIL